MSERERERKRERERERERAAGFFSSRAKSLYGPAKAKYVLKCPGGTLERDEWMAAIQVSVDSERLEATRSDSDPGVLGPVI